MSHRRISVRTTASARVRAIVVAIDRYRIVNGNLTVFAKGVDTDEIVLCTSTRFQDIASALRITEGVANKTIGTVRTTDVVIHVATAGACATR